MSGHVSFPNIRPGVPGIILEAILSEDPSEKYKVLILPSYTIGQKLT